MASAKKITLIKPFYILPVFKKYNCNKKLPESCTLAINENNFFRETHLPEAQN